MDWLLRGQIKVAASRLKNTASKRGLALLIVFHRQEADLPFHLGTTFILRFVNASAHLTTSTVLD